MNAMSFLQRTVLRIICGVMAFVMLALLAMSLIFSGTHIAPSLFGTNIFIVKNDSFSLVKRGYALFSKTVPPTDITPGNLIIFRLPGVTAVGKSDISADLLGEVQNVSADGGTHTFEIKDENGTRMYITETNLVGKAMSFSAFWGFVISFAVSPAGVTLIAVIPCAIVLALEGTKIFTARQEHTERLRPVVRTGRTSGAGRDKPAYITANKATAGKTANFKTSELSAPDNVPDEDTEFELSVSPEPRLDSFSESYNENLPSKNAGVVAKYMNNTAGSAGNNASINNASINNASINNASIRPPKNFSTYEDLNPTERRRRLLSQQRLNEVLAQTRRPNKPRRDNTLDTLKLSELANAREQLLEHARITDIRKEAARGNIDDRAGVSEYKELIAERERRDRSERSRSDYLDSTSRAAARDVRREMTDTGRLPAIPAYEWERGENYADNPRGTRGVRPPVQMFPVGNGVRDLRSDPANEYEPRVTSSLSAARRTPVSKAVLAQTSVIPNLDEMLMDEEEAVY